MANIKAKEAPVQATDELTKAIEAAQARIAEVYAHGRNTLADQIPLAEWNTRNASDELALVADSAGIDGDDWLDADCALDVAA